IVRRNSIICPSGRGPGFCMAPDLNAEHGVDALKTLFLAKGVLGDWDRLGDGAACIMHAEAAKRKISSAFGLSYQSQTHTTPSTRALVFKVADKVKEHDLLTADSLRKNTHGVKPTVDLLNDGRARLRSQSIPAFNKRLELLQQGKEWTEDVDELPPMSITFTSDSDDVISSDDT
ncbi:hypothetical protein CONPUDRAFT_58071, partial [Coniophora puteana RWD-64-598 SS2]